MDLGRTVGHCSDVGVQGVNVLNAATTTLFDSAGTTLQRGWTADFGVHYSLGNASIIGTWTERAGLSLASTRLYQVFWYLAPSSCPCLTCAHGLWWDFPSISHPAIS